MDKKRKIYVAVSAFLLLAVMATIFILSAQDSEKSSETSGDFFVWLKAYFNLPFSEDTLRTLAHFSEFALLGILALNFNFALKQTLRPVFCGALSWLYAWSDEIHQIFVEGRAFQLTDLAVDLAGIACGTLFLFLILTLFQKTKLKIE